MLVKTQDQSLKAMSNLEFNAFIQHVSAPKKIQVKKPKVTEVVTLDDENSKSKQPMKSTIETLKDLFPEASTSTSAQDKSSIKLDHNMITSFKDLNQEVRVKIEKAKLELSALPSSDPTRVIGIEFAQIHSRFADIIEQLVGSLSIINTKVENANSDIRIIPEYDATKDQGNITLIEGILPVKTAKYKKAISSLQRDTQNREPSNVITILSRTCFPDHWVSNVTLKGKSGRKSLISLWNHEFPLTVPCSGNYNEQLGKARYQALLDHTMRKSGRKSYDSEAEKHLSTVLAKAIHYKRTKVSLAKESKWEQFLDDEGSSCSDEDKFSYTSDKAADDEDYQDDDDYVLPKPKDRRLEASSHSKKRKIDVILGKTPHFDLFNASDDDKFLNDMRLIDDESRSPILGESAAGVDLSPRSTSTPLRKRRATQFIDSTEIPINRSPAMKDHEQEPNDAQESGFISSTNIVSGSEKAADEIFGDQFPLTQAALLKVAMERAADEKQDQDEDSLILNINVDDQLQSDFQDSTSGPVQEDEKKKDEEEEKNEELEREAEDKEKEIEKNTVEIDQEEETQSVNDETSSICAKRSSDAEPSISKRKKISLRNSPETEQFNQDEKTNSSTTSNKSFGKKNIIDQATLAFLNDPANHGILAQIMAAREKGIQKK